MPKEFVIAQVLCIIVRAIFSSPYKSRMNPGKCDTMQHQLLAIVEDIPIQKYQSCSIVVASL